LSPVSVFDPTANGVKPAPLPASGPGARDVVIETDNAWVEFPIFDAKSRSLKKTFLGKAGGTIGRNTSNVLVI
jgi:ABC-2 type transport system ATP-binding protein